MQHADAQKGKEETRRELSGCCAQAIRSLSMEARMSICNMAIEAGARAGLIQPDEITFEYLRNRPMVPSEDEPDWEAAKDYWRSLATVRCPPSQRAPLA